jgi:hypothetical protein
VKTKRIVVWLVAGAGAWLGGCVDLAGVAIGPAPRESSDNSGLGPNEQLTVGGNEDRGTDVPTESLDLYDESQQVDGDVDQGAIDSEKQYVTAPALIALHGGEGHVCGVDRAGRIYLTSSSTEWRVFDRFADSDFYPTAIFCPFEDRIMVVGGARSGEQGLILEFNAVDGLYASTDVEIPLVAVHGQPDEGGVAVAVGSSQGRQLLLLWRGSDWDAIYEAENGSALHDVWVAADGRFLAVGADGLLLHGAPQLGVDMVESRLDQVSLLSVTHNSALERWLVGSEAGVYRGTPHSGWERESINAEHVFDLFPSARDEVLYALTSAGLFWRSAFDQENQSEKGWSALGLGDFEQSGLMALFDSPSYGLIIGTADGSSFCEVSARDLGGPDALIDCR